MQKQNLKDKFEHYYQQIRQHAFLNMEAIGNEIPFYIAPYSAAQENDVVKAIAALRKRLKTLDIHTLEINLYDLSLGIIQREDDLEDIFEEEAASDKAEFLETMQSILDVETEVIPAIAKRLEHKPYQVLLITGVGQVFPFIRSHNVLNNLQRIAKDAPTIMFFPGAYVTSRSGSYLRLFDLLKDDNYYRAFNLDNINLQSS
jgi:hypothetical protein